MLLTKENYHSNEANRFYMSNSQYQNFLDCEAMAMAKIDGWKEPENDALLIGSYVHAYFEGPEEFQEFIDTHPEMFSSKGPTKGELKSTFLRANEMIRIMKDDPLCQFVMRGHKEVILTAELYGAPWKVKLDNYDPENNRFADLKTTQNIRKEIWDPKNGYVTFVEGYGYVTQIAIYAEVERVHAGRDGWLEPVMVAVSKEEPPDKEVIGFKAFDIERELEGIAIRMPRILEVKQGIAEPERCGKCRYCRETKQLHRIVYYADLRGA